MVAVTLAEKSKIADVMEAKWFEPGEIIIEQVIEYAITCELPALHTQ